MTKVHNFSLLGLACFVKDKQMLKTEDTKEIGYYPSQTNLWSFSTEMSFFTEDFWDFSTNHSGSIIGKTSSPLLSG